MWLYKLKRTKNLHTPRDDDDSFVIDCCWWFLEFFGFCIKIDQADVEDDEKDEWRRWRYEEGEERRWWK